MIILNVTVIIDPAIEIEWLGSIKSNYIPAVMATGCFISYRVLTVLNSPNEGITYCIQYNAESLDLHEQYNHQFANQIKHAHFKEFENKFVMFETIMELVNEI